MAESSIQDLLNSVRNLTGATIEITTESDFLDIYDITGGLILTNSWQDIPFTNSRQTSIAYEWTPGEAEIEFNNEGTYVVMSRTNVRTSSGTGRSSSAMQVVYDGGSGYEVLSGTSNGMYHRQLDDGQTMSISTFIVSTQPGDKLKMQVQQTNGGDTLETTPNGSSLSIFNTKGAKGEDAEIIIKNEGFDVTGSPHNKLNFTGTYVDVTDAGSGQVDINFDLYDTLPSLQVINSSTTLSTSWSDINFETLDIETDSSIIEQTSSNRITVKTGGTYMITYSSSITDPSEARVRKNGTDVLNGSYQEGNKILSNSFIVNLNTNDYITLQAQSTTSETLSATTFSIFILDGAKGGPGVQGENGPSGIGMYAWARTSAAGSELSSNGLTVSRIATGTYQYTFDTPTPDTNYIITGQHYGTDTDTNIFTSSITTTGFVIDTGVGDNGGTPDTRQDTEHSVIINGPIRAASTLTAYTYSRDEADSIFAKNENSSDTQIIYNNVGTLTGSSDFTFSDSEFYINKNIRTGSNNHELSRLLWIDYTNSEVRVGDVNDDIVNDDRSFVLETSSDASTAYKSIAFSKSGTTIYSLDHYENKFGVWYQSLGDYILRGDSTYINIPLTTTSTSETTGALTVDGGVGIAENLNIGGLVKLTDTTSSTTDITGALTVAGGVGIDGALNVGRNGANAGDYSQFGDSTNYIRLGWTNNSSGGSPKGLLFSTFSPSGGEKYSAICGIITSASSGNKAAIQGFGNGSAGNMAAIYGSISSHTPNSTDVSIAGLFSDNDNDLDGAFNGISLIDGNRYGIAAGVTKNNSLGDNIGVYGYAINGGTGSSYAGYFNGNISIQGSQFVNITTVNTTTYDLATDDYILHVTTAVTSLTLPTAQAVSGRTIIVKDGVGNATVDNIVIDTEGTETIDGQNSFTINTNYESVTLYCDGSNWFII